VPGLSELMPSLLAASIDLAVVLGGMPEFFENSCIRTGPIARSARWALILVGSCRAHVQKNRSCRFRNFSQAPGWGSDWPFKRSLVRPFLFAAHSLIVDARAAHDLC